ncbi:MAG: hypothetical protein U0746_05430 [Gemmataceae bacterium]
MGRHVHLGLVGLAMLAAVVGLAFGQPTAIHREGFEGRDPLWVRGPANVAFQEESHILTDKFKHGDATSELIQIQADAAGKELNPFVHYTLPVPNAPVSDDLRVRLWVRSNRSNVQLLVRVVLPRMRNPANLNEPLTTTLRGESYSMGGGHWQALEVRRPVKLLKDEQQRLRAQLQTDVNVADAYVDRLILNLYAGPGLTQVWTDDAEIGPIAEEKRTTVQAQPTTLSKVVTPAPSPRVETTKRSATVEFTREQLRVNGRGLIFRGIRHSDTPLKALRDAGLNTLFVSDRLDPAIYDEAIKQGFWLVPTLSADRPDPEALARETTRFAADDAVLFWYLGGDRRAKDYELTARASRAVHDADPQRPVAADAWDGMFNVSRHVDLLAAHRFPLMTSLELPQYRDWLTQRRLLARPGTFFWTWVQTHMQDWFLRVAYDGGQGPFEEPVGPQAEQIRLMTYLALSAGCKGLGFWSDRFLADSHQGRDRLLALALLNQELTMLEPLLLSAFDAPIWIDTSIPDVKAAILRCERGMLVLPLWLGAGAQFVPGQAAARQLTIRVPQVPVGTQAWHVSPADVTSLPTRRIVGGTEVTLREFDQSAAIVFTSDNSPNGLLVRWQDQSRRMAKMAAQWSYDLARVELDKVEKVQAELTELAKVDKAPTVPDADSLLKKARSSLDEAKAAWDSNDFGKAYHDAQRALRPARILMRAHWEAAAKSLGPDAPPTASPYAVSFYTLAKHWKFRADLSACTPGGNALPTGDFEKDGLPPGWQPAQSLPDDVDGEARLTNVEPHEGRQCLMLQVRPKVPPGANTPAPLALEPTFVGAVSPPVNLPPGSLVRISGWVKLAKPVTASADGVLLFDSIGGEPLGVRLTAATNGWKRFTLFRRVPSSGQVQVTAALTGLGSAYFDDLRIEPLQPKTN